MPVVLIIFNLYSSGLYGFYHGLSSCCDITVDEVKTEILCIFTALQLYERISQLGNDINNSHLSFSIEHEALHQPRAVGHLLFVVFRSLRRPRASEPRAHPLLGSRCDLH